MSLKSKVVLVTGASSGIGAATAVAFAVEGAQVAIVGRNKTKLANVAKTCEQKGSAPLIITADVCIDEDVIRIINDTIKHYGRLDVLINNAGIYKPTSIISSDAMDGFDTIMSTNLRSTVYLTHLAAPHLVKSKGNIVNVSSIAGIGTVMHDSFAYATSKAGMDHFTRAVALELAKDGVRVNAVNPGPVKTDIALNAGFSKEHVDALEDMYSKAMPLRKVAEPEEVADLILFLASDKAKSITGSTYVTDNGALLIGPIRPLE